MVDLPGDDDNNNTGSDQWMKTTGMNDRGMVVRVSILTAAAGGGVSAAEDISLSLVGAIIHEV